MREVTIMNYETMAPVKVPMEFASILIAKTGGGKIAAKFVSTYISDIKEFITALNELLRKKTDIELDVVNPYFRLIGDKANVYEILFQSRRDLINDLDNEKLRELSLEVQVLQEQICADDKIYIYKR